MRTMSGYAMVGGTIPPQSDSGEISRVLVLNLLWQSKRCSRTAQDISVLTTPSLLSRATRRVRSPMFLNLWLASPNLRFAAHNLNAAQIRMCQSIRTPSTNIASAHLLGAHRLAPPLPRHVCSQNQDVPHAKCHFDTRL